MTLGPVPTAALFLTHCRAWPTFDEAARILDRDEFRQVAERNSELLLGELRQENGRLLRTWKSNPEQAKGTGEAKLDGYLAGRVHKRSSLCRHRLSGTGSDAIPHWWEHDQPYPLGFGQWLEALSYTLAQPKEIAIVGEPDSTDTLALLEVVRASYQPFQVATLGGPGRQPLLIRLFRSKHARGRAGSSLYVQ